MNKLITPIPIKNGDTIAIQIGKKYRISNPDSVYWSKEGMVYTASYFDDGIVLTRKDKFHTEYTFSDPWPLVCGFGMCTVQHLNFTGYTIEEEP